MRWAGAVAAPPLLVADDYEYDVSDLLPITQQTESGGRDYVSPGVPVRSPAGALFAMQVRPSTAADPGYGVKPAAAQTPAEYNRVGTELLGKFLDRYGDPAKAWGAYHAGPGNLNNAVAQYGENWLQGVGPATRAYVAKNMAALGQAQPSAGTGQMEDDDQEDGTGALAALAQAPQSGAPQQDAAPTMSLAELIRQRQALGVQQQSAAQSAYEAAAQQLQQQRQRTQGGLSSADLFKLSAAFLTPTRYSNFMGSLGNVMPVLGDIASARETAAQNYPAQLAALQQKYLQDRLAAQAGVLHDIAAPVTEQAKLGKPVADKYAAIPAGGRLVNVSALNRMPPLTKSALAANVSPEMWSAMTPAERAAFP